MSYESSVEVVQVRVLLQLNLKNGVLTADLLYIISVIITEAHINQVNPATALHPATKIQR